MAQQKCSNNGVRTTPTHMVTQFKSVHINNQSTVNLFFGLLQFPFTKNNSQNIGEKQIMSIVVLDSLKFKVQ